MLLLDLIWGRKVNTSLHLTTVFINASHDESFCLSLASRCQRGERRYIKLSNKHQATTRRLRELEKFHQKYSVLVNSDKTSTVSCWYHRYFLPVVVCRIDDPILLQKVFVIIVIFTVY